MTRGFSLIELLIAFAVLASTLVAIALVAFGTPRMIQNAYLELTASSLTSGALAKLNLLGLNHFEMIAPIASTSMDGYIRSLSVETIDDDAAKRVVSTVDWRDASGRMQTLSYLSLVTDYMNAPLHPCDPFLSGDWHTPRILGSYALAAGSLLPLIYAGKHFPISALAIYGSTLAVAISSTDTSTDPTLFFFDIQDSSAKPGYISPAFDNASTSRSGYTALASGPSMIYAANGFGSASTITCSLDPASCAQIHGFAISGAIPRRVMSFQAPQSLALTMGGAIAAGSALTYRDGKLYLGLEKTAGGQELQIIDVQEPGKANYIGGYAVGRGVNDISADGMIGYVATDDNSASGKALLALDLHDLEHSTEMSSYRFPGAGYAKRLARTKDRLYVGRSFASGSSEELSIMDRTTDALTRVDGIDIGTTKTPGGVRGLILRDFLAFILSESSLQIWKADSSMAAYASVPVMHGTGTALACRNNILYIGSVGSDGTGYLTMVTSS